MIQTIHYLRSIHDNDVSFLIGGDLNKIDIQQFLDCYGALKQAISVPTRKSAASTNIITDICNLYYPPTTLPPLQVDEGKKAADADHQVVVFAPMSNTSYLKPRCKKTIFTQSGMNEFGKEITTHEWKEVLDVKDIDLKVQNFHETLRKKINQFVPEKIVKISNLDKNG